MSGDRNSGCRSSAAIGGSSGGRSSSGGKGSGGRHPKGSGIKKAGWEDAGLEFYREAYPGALENLYDPSLRTLLPSKRYSIGTLGRATTRRRASVRSRRRRQSSAATTLVHTTRRGSDTYLEVLPDLTQGVDEEETWEQLQQIRLHAVSMQEKRHLKRQLLSAPTLRTRGFAAVQLSRRKFFSRLKTRFNEIISKFGLWHSSLRYVEGNFGTGLVAFFTFMKWLLFLNLFSSLLIVAFIVLPQVFYMQPADWCAIAASENETELLPSPTDVFDSISSSLPDILESTYSNNISPSPFVLTTAENFIQSTESNSGHSSYEDAPSIISDYIPSDYSHPSNDYSPGSYDSDIRYEEEISPPPLTLSVGPTYPFSSSFPLTILSKSSPETSPLPSVLPELPDTTIISDGNISDYLPLYSAFLDGINGSSQCCFAKYKERVMKKESSQQYFIQLLLDSLQGTGMLELSHLFYGFYPRANFTIPEIYNFQYRLPLAYLCVMVFILALSLILMVRKAARGLKDSLRSSEGQFYQFSNLVFGGWDHCIENNKAATIKKKAIFNELKNFIETERYKDEKEQRTRRERCRLYFIRLLINLLVICILSASFFAIYKATSFAFESLTSLKGAEYWMTGRAARALNFNILGDDNELNSPPGNVTWWHTLILEFLPVGTIVVLNIVVPIIFKILIQMEKYTPNFILTFTLIRTIFLRLASLVVLLFTLYQRIRVCNTAPQSECVSSDEGCSDQIKCWETYVGQQLYKLTILDLVIMAMNTFLINLPRKIIGHKILRGSRIGEVIGSIEFEIPKHVLDIVYGQTLCWLGMFYSPLLPLITCIKLVLVFYIKYFDCAVNTTQSSQLYRTSRSNSLFISILLISFIVTIIPVGFSIAELRPSVSCGPFYTLPTIWSEVINLIEASPQWLQNFLFFLGTAGFAVPTIILLILAAYYYYAVAAANKHMVSLLKHQLVLEGHDKQFLLTRLDKMIKRTQQLEELQRSEMSSDFNGDYGTAGNNDLTLDIRGS